MFFRCAQKKVSLDIVNKILMTNQNLETKAEEKSLSIENIKYYFTRKSSVFEYVFPNEAYEANVKYI